MERAIAIVMAIWFALGALAAVALIGKPRTPITHGAAIFNMITAILLMLGVVYLARN